MIFVKDHRTRYLVSPYPFGPRRQAHVDSSWAALFRRDILEELPVERFAKYYREGRGRPSKELHAGMGALLLQQMFDLTDEQTVEQFSFNLLWHYALGITGTADAEAYLSERTLWTLRRRLIESGLAAELFDLVTKKLVAVFDVDTSRQRLDSTHLFSNMRHLGRIGLFAATIRRFLGNLRRQHRERFAELGEEFTGRYIGKGDGVFSLVKPSEAERTLQALAEDLFGLVERFKDVEVVGEMSSYKLLVRLLREQCVASPEQSEGPKVGLKAPKEISSNSLQGPSDPDATYSGHKGKGYTGQVAETFNPERPADGTVPNLITHAEVHPAHVSDVHATVPAIEGAQQRGLGPQQLVADTLYGSDENVCEAKERGVELVTPAAGKADNPLDLDNAFGLEAFKIDKRGHVLRCPQGQVPASYSRVGEEVTAIFTHETCGACQDYLRCPARWSEEGWFVRVTPKKRRLAKRRSREKTPAFRGVYRWRAGIEGTISQIKRRTGAGHLRYRGLPRIQACFKLKAAGINILRAAAALAARLAERLLARFCSGNSLAIALRLAVRTLLEAVSDALEAPRAAHRMGTCG